MSEENYKEAGNVAFREGNYALAVEQYSKGLEEPNLKESVQALLLSNRSASFKKLGKYAEALADAEQCILVHPTWPKGYFRKADALEMLGRLYEAETEFTALLAKIAGEKDVEERLQKVRAEIKRRASIPPSQCVDAEEAKTIGNLHFKEARYEKACEFYSFAIDHTPDSDPNKANYYNNRAACNTQIHNYSMVVADCTSCLELDPSNQKARLRRAYAYKGLEKWKAAIEDFKAVNQIAPSAQYSQEIARLSSYLQ